MSKYPYSQHRNNAQRRGIPFLLTYEEWLNIWTASGHLDRRGNRGGYYVMARLGDRGAYEIGNVHIILFEENSADRREDAKTRQKTSLALTGKVRTAEHSANIAKAKLGKPLTAEHRQAIGIGVTGEKNPFYGKRHSAETRARISAAATKRPRDARGRLI